MSDILRVVVTDHVSETGLAPLLEDARFQVARIDDSSSDEFHAALAEADGLVVRSATKVSRDMLAMGPRLRVIGRAGVGVDNIDLLAATERGIAVLNSPAGNTVAAAELTMALILSVVRRVAEADRSMRDGGWERSRLRGVQLKDRTLGLIGAGRIGSEVAIRCRAFGMKVLVYDPYLTAGRAEDLGLPLTGFDEVIERGDIISLHVPLNDETWHLIDEAALSRMKPGAFVVNVSRGGVIDEVALARVLTDGHLAGAALDVFESEPLPPDSPLLGLHNVVLTPHLGASTVEAQELVAREISESVRDALVLGDFSGSITT
jgi:D-3-phosphoglycerate dehydrogenase